ncbi:hypothetical protein CHS0354_015643 [Potamilus streckersoni]|uniref:Peptidase M12B propeptide domain-containing protein n=1 Tax=Potamilus streckersoni TaxID=2493646 RepID=A0AAE0VUH2_9BIVA|nr:hypothetical protein CHS0354_015643 [Potamilus streckersoni]
MKLFLIYFAVFTLAGSEPKFHDSLSTEELLHYFGTNSPEKVPRYEYATPKRVMAQIVRERRYTNMADLIYHLKTIEEEIIMNLRMNKDLVSPGCVVHHKTKNGTGTLYPCSTPNENCYFFGHVENRNDSWVALSICDGMNGVISLPHKNLVVKSINPMHLIHAQKDTKIMDPHLVYEISNKGHTFDALSK